MKLKWEYMVADLLVGGPPGLTETQAQQRSLDVFGRLGWELVSVYDGTAYFKRLSELKEVPPRPEPIIEDGT